MMINLTVLLVTALIELALVAARLGSFNPEQVRS